MASYLRSRLPHLRHTALSLPKTQILSHPLPHDAFFMFSRWGTSAKAFCHKPSGVVDDGPVESHLAVKKGKLSRKEKPIPTFPLTLDSLREYLGHDDKLKALAKRKVMLLCKKKLPSQITKFPREVLEDNRRLRQLFDAWMVEYEKGYRSAEEKNQKFEMFKYNVYRIALSNEFAVHHEDRLGPNEDYLPGDRPVS